MKSKYIFGLLSFLILGTANAGDVLVYTGEGAYSPAWYSYFGVATGKTIVRESVLPPDLSAFDCILLPANGFDAPAFSGATLAALSAYVNSGGRLIAQGDNDRFFTETNAAMNQLATNLGSDLHLVNATIDIGGNITSNIHPSPFTVGVSSLYYGATSQVAVSVGPYAHSLAGTAYTDTTFIGVDKIGRGIFFLLGDINVLTNNTGYTVRDNGVLAANMCDLVSFDKEISFDIKFCSDPNAFNCKKKGVLPVTIFGTEDLLVEDIDPSTLQLCNADLSACTEAPRDYSYADRGDPTTDLGAAMCAINPDTEEEEDFLNQDLYLDLDAAFEASEIKAILGDYCDDAAKGDVSGALVIIGETYDGVPIYSVPQDDNTGIDRLVKANK